MTNSYRCKASGALSLHQPGRPKERPQHSVLGEPPLDLPPVLQQDDLNMIHLIQWGLDMQAQFRLLTEEHHVDRYTVVLAWGPCSSAGREPSRSQIEPVQCNGTVCGRATSPRWLSAGSFNLHAQAGPWRGGRSVGGGEEKRKAKRKHELCFACKCCCLVDCGSDAAQPSRL